MLTKKFYSDKADIWSLGCVLYFMISGKPLIFLCIEDQHKAIQEIAAMLAEQHINLDLKFPQDFSFQGQDLIQKMLDRNYRTRITIEEILDHEWVIGENEEQKLDLDSLHISQPEIQEPEKAIYEENPKTFFTIADYEGFLKIRRRKSGVKLKTLFPTKDFL